MDNPFEQCVKKEDYTKDKIKYAIWNGTFLVTALIALLALLLTILSGNYMVWLSIVVFAGLIAFFAYFKKSNAIIEYDYSFYDNTITISRISNNSKRKDMISIKREEIVEIAPIRSNNFQRYKNVPGIKLKNFVLNNIDDSYYIYYQQGGGNGLVLWEPNEKLLKAIKDTKPAAVTL